MDTFIAILIMAIMIAVYIAIQKNSPTNRRARKVIEALACAGAFWDSAPARLREQILTRPEMSYILPREIPSLIVQPWIALGAVHQSMIGNFILEAGFRASREVNAESPLRFSLENEQPKSQKSADAAIRPSPLRSSEGNQPTNPNERSGKDDKLDGVASEIAEIIASNYSSALFADMFGSKNLRSGWTYNDALAIWYCLGYVVLLVSVGTTEDRVSVGTALLDAGLEHLIRLWQMPQGTYRRFATFNQSKLGSALALYRATKDARQYHKFFTLFVAEILGGAITFAPELLSPSSATRTSLINTQAF